VHRFIWRYHRIRSFGRLTDGFSFLHTGLTGAQLNSICSFSGQLHRRYCLFHRFIRRSIVGLTGVRCVRFVTALDNDVAFEFVGLSGAVSSVEPTPFKRERRINRCSIVFAAGSVSSV